MRTLKRLVLLLLVGGAAFTSGYALRAIKGAGAPPARKVLYYVDPMHPAYKSDKPGIAPDCGMALEPVYADPQPTARAADDGRTPAGAIHVPIERQQLIGVKFTRVEVDSSSRAIRTVGTVAADESRIVRVHPRFDGWIEKVFVDFTGALVTQGQPMLTIYSPEMLASQQELLLASRARALMRDNPLASAAEHGESLFEAARHRLSLWQLSAADIDRVLESGQPIASVAVAAPAAGFVTERNAFPNQRVTGDTDLYTITDLGRIWIMADAFESDVAAIKIGSLAYVSFPNGSAPPLGARVAYIQPQLDPATRTMKVRLEAANPGFRMKPDMFVNVEFGVAGAPRLVVPADAVLDTGDRKTVFVDLGGGYLEPREVEIGDRIGDRLVVERGLEAGERVVSSGTFLIDSESQLRAAAAGMGAPPDRPPQDGGTAASATAAPRTPTPGEPRHD